MVRLAIAAAALVLAAAGCGSDSSSPESAAAPSPPPAGTPTQTGPEGPDPAENPCAMVPPGALATVFTKENPPKGDSNPMGKGFATCTWAGDGATLLVSVVPAPNFDSDYKSQLNIS